MSDTPLGSNSVNSGGIELQVTNLDPGIEQRDVRQLITSLFSECVAISSVSVYRLDGGSVGAVVKVAGLQEAQLAISQLHKRKIGAKRISISMVPTEGAVLPKKEVVSLLQSFPGGKIQLFKFRQMFEERFRGSISVADLHKMKDIVSLTEDVAGQGRMVTLNTNTMVETDEVEMLYCPLHSSVPNNVNGWGDKRVWEGLPDVVVSLEALSTNIRKMLKNHKGSVPLASLLYCYNAECEELVTVASDDGKHGVPLEHLLQAVKGVIIKVGSTGIKKLVEATPANCAIKYSDLVGPPPALAGAMITFTREVVEMLKALPGCKIPFYKFIPRYHHHFGKQCRVADYGYTKLRDLLESMPHVIQIIGEGSKTIITLAHKAQVRRFTNDILKMLKNSSEKHLKLSEFSKLYEETFFKALNIFDYGVCHLNDLFSELPENTLVFEEIKDECQNTMDIVISVFKRVQNQEEVIRTRAFAKEVVELLRHAPDLAISFNKFIPAYHQHFGRQCRVGSYGMSKLIELFEAIPDTVEVRDDGEERMVQLIKDKMIWVVGEQVECIVKNCRTKSVALIDLEDEYQKTYGHNIPLNRMGVESLEELVSVLQSWVRMVDTKDGAMVVTVDRGFIRTMASNVRKLMVEQERGCMNYDEFVNIMATRFGSHVEMEMIVRDLSYLVEVKEGGISLTPLQLCARDIELVLGEVGKLPVAELETQYEAKFGRELPLEPLGFDSVGELLAAMNDTLSVSGRGIRKVVRVNKSATSALSPGRPSSLVLPHLVSTSTPSSSKPSPVASFSGRGFDMIRTLPPQSTPRSYSGVLQSGGVPPSGGDVNMNFSRSVPPPNLNVPNTPMRYNVPPPNYLQNYPPPPLVGSPQSSFLNHNLIPTAAPNSPVTPTTPRTFNFPFPLYSFFNKPVLGSPMSTSPITSGAATFQQHMMHHSPSPLITPSCQSPFIVQPISRGNPEQAFSMASKQEDLSQSLKHGLSFGSVDPISMSSLDTSYY